MDKKFPLLEENASCDPSKLYLISEVTGIAGGGQLVEDVEKKNGRPVYFSGKYQEADLKNKNGRVYPEPILRPEIDRLNSVASAYCLFGEVDHPEDAVIHLADAGHLNVKLWWEGKKVLGTAIIIPSPAGRILEACFLVGAKVGISSRGIGTGQVGTDGALHIAEGYRCITFDAVGDPSTPEAYAEVAAAAGIASEHVRILRSVAESIVSGDSQRGRAVANETARRTLGKTLVREVDMRADQTKCSDQIGLLNKLLKELVAEKMR